MRSSRTRYHQVFQKTILSPAEGTQLGNSPFRSECIPNTLIKQLPSGSLL